jgi:hypothetical protein
MGTERDDNPAIREVRFLMRMQTNLNAGAMLALCLWLAWAALDYNSHQREISGKIEVHGCGCALSEVTNWSGNLNIAASGH